MELFYAKFQLFSLLFARMLSLLSIMPGFGGMGVSYFHRVALSFLISVTVTPVIGFDPEFDRLLQTTYFTILIEQVFIGLMIGVAVHFVFAAFQMAGEFFSVQMGFGISEVFDPLAQVSMPLMGTLKNMMGLYVFFISSAHLHIIRAVAYSFEILPSLSNGFLTSSIIHNGFIKFLALLGSGMFVIALKIAMPVMGTLFLVSVTLGILSKAAPQMNMLMLGFPLKIMIAFMVLTWTAPVIVETMIAQFDNMLGLLELIIDRWAKLTI